MGLSFLFLEILGDRFSGVAPRSLCVPVSFSIYKTHRDKKHTEGVGWMIVDESFDVKVNKLNIDWYRSRGFSCELRDIVNVNVRDLIKGSTIVVRYICDRCGCEKKLKFSSFSGKQDVNGKTYCKSCANIIFRENKYKPYYAVDGFKICRHCNRKLPADTDYFYISPRTPDGWNYKCKECFGKKFTNHLTHIPKDGHKFCKKCDRELPIHNRYFTKDDGCRDGFRGVCRECMGRGFLKEEHVPPKIWSEEEIVFFKSVYPHYTNEELVELHYPGLKKKQLWDLAYRIGVSYKTDEAKKRRYKAQSEKMSGENSPMYGVPLSEERKKQHSMAMKEYYKTHVSYWKGRKRSKKQGKHLSDLFKKRGVWKGKKNPRHKNPLRGADNGNWKGGITPLYFELRSETKEWQQQSMKDCNYKCVLSGLEFDNVHHLYPFRNIVNEVFDILELDQRQKVEDYTKEEFAKIKDKMFELHDHYGLGVCLSKNIHKTFHDVYGYSDNTPEQFYEFELRYKNFEFDHLLDDKYKYCNVKD